MPRLLHLIAAAWLVLALPLGQHEALLHALGHATNGSLQDPASPPEKCPDHSLYTAFAGTLGGAPQAATIAAGDAPQVAHQPASPTHRSPRHSYLSRAPPASPAPS